MVLWFVEVGVGDHLPCLMSYICTQSGTTPSRHLTVSLLALALLLRPLRLGEEAGTSQGYHERAQIPYPDVCGLLLVHDTKIWGPPPPLEPDEFLLNSVWLVSVAD